MKPILIIDSHYLCYRAMYTMGNLSFDERPTGIIFGFLNQILQLAIRFDYPRFIFAWDSKRSCRRDVYPNYKQKDKEITQDMLELLGISKPQFSTLRIQVLPRIGFANNFIQTGLEADDIIAMIVNSYYNPFVIVSADNDLYQLLSPNVNLYDSRTKQQYTRTNFINEFTIPPTDWPEIKALAGCDGDNVKGLPGVGEKTAIKWLKNMLKGKKLALITENYTKMYQINFPLVSLPHEKTKHIKLLADSFSFKCFEDMCLEYGFRSFLKKGVYEKWQKILS